MSDFALPFTGRRLRRSSVLVRIWAVLAVAFPLVGRWLIHTAGRVRQVLLVLGSLASVCYAGWQVAEPLGWLLIGLAGLYLEAITGPETD